MSKVGKIERKSRFGVGTFFFGTFIGFLFTIALIVGLGCFAYFNISAKWINKTFKTEIDLGSEDLNKITLNKLVNSAIYLGKNLDNYTLNDLKKDFGLNFTNNLSGIDISDLKSVPFKNMVSSISDKFKNISAQELNSFLSDSATLTNIMNKSATYYFNIVDSKLYCQKSGDVYSQPVTFSYKVENNNIKIKNFSPIGVNADNTVSIQLKHLPLTTAIDEFTTNLGDNTTIGELKSQYGVTLPSYFDNIDDNATINQLEGEIQDIYLADFLGYTISGDDVYQNSTQINGVMKIFAKMQIKDLENAKQTIDDLYIAEVLGYNYNTLTGKVTDQSGNEITGILGAVSKFTIANITDSENGIESLKIGDLFEASSFNDGILTLLADCKDTTELSEIPNVLQTKITTATINDLVTKNVINSSSYNSTVAEKEIIVGGSPKKVKNCNITELMDSYFAILATLP